MYRPSNQVFDVNQKSGNVEDLNTVKRLPLKLTRRHINRRHFCFNIKSISVHPLLWMNCHA